MSISFTCTHCSREYTLSESLAGKRAQCKECGAQFRIPSAATIPADRSTGSKNSTPRPPSKRAASRSKHSSSDLRNPYGIQVSTDWVPPTFEVDSRAIPRAKRAASRDTRDRPADFADDEEFAEVRAQRPEAVETSLPPKNRLFELDVDEPIAPRRAPVAGVPSRSSGRNSSGESIEIFNKGSGFGIFLIVIGTIMYGMVTLGWVIVRNGVANDPGQQQKTAVALLFVGLLCIFISVALVFAKAVSYRARPRLGAGGVVGYLFAAICSGFVLFGSINGERRPNGPGRANQIRANTVRPGAQPNRSSTPKPPPRTFRPPR